jgi:DNA-binding NarL/FixJ family response regulator
MLEVVGEKRPTRGRQAMVKLVMPTPQPNLHCVIVDDHEMLLDLLVSAVETIPGATVVATGTDVVDAERLAELERVDLLVVDRRLKTGGGVDVVRRMLVRHPALKSILIAGTTADFVCPADLLDVVVSVIDKAHASEALLAEIVRVGNLPERAADERMRSCEIRARLTARELQIFTALGDGLSNKDLGSRFGISTRTVETHRKAIAKKLGLSGSALVRLAVLERHAGGNSQRPKGQAPSISAPDDGDA